MAYEFYDVVALADGMLARYINGNFDEDFGNANIRGVTYGAFRFIEGCLDYRNFGFKCEEVVTE